MYLLALMIEGDHTSSPLFVNASTIKVDFHRPPLIHCFGPPQSLPGQLNLSIHVLDNWWLQVSNSTMADVLR
jgi:hypothetical protein